MVVDAEHGIRPDLLRNAVSHSAVTPMDSRGSNRFAASESLRFAMPVRITDQPLSSSSFAFSISCSCDAAPAVAKQGTKSRCLPPSN